MALLFNTDPSNQNNLPRSIRRELCYPGLYVFNPQPPDTHPTTHFLLTV